MPFYNPYLKGRADWGSGIGDIFNKIAQIAAMKGMFAKSGDTSGQQIPMQPQMGGATMGQVQGGMSKMPGMDSLGGGQGMDMDPESKNMLLKLLQAMFGSAGAGAAGAAGGGIPPIF